MNNATQSQLAYRKYKPVQTQTIVHYFNDAYTLLNNKLNELITTEVIWLSALRLSAESKSLHVAALVDRQKDRNRNQIHRDVKE